MCTEISIIIVNYHTETLVSELVESIIEFTNNNAYEVIIIDNGSSDERCLDRLTTADNFRLIKNDVNIGFAAANNIGIKASCGKYICMLNPDTILRNDAISMCVDFLDTHQAEGVRCVGAILEDVCGQAIFSYGKFSNFWWDIFYYYAYALKKCLNIKRSLYTHQFRNTNNVLEVDYITGAFLVFPKILIYDLGFFDEQFFMYSEEVDLQLRMSKLNYSRVIIPGPRVVHLEGKSYKLSNSRRSMMTVGRLRYIKKHNGAIAYWFSKSNYILSVVISTAADTYYKEYTFLENLNHIKSVISNEYR